MARDKHQTQHQDYDGDTPAEEQPKRPFDMIKDYFKLRRFRSDFGREFNLTNYWKV